MSALSLMYVAIGGAIGSMGRYVLMNFITRLHPTSEFPYHTFIVNILGAFVMGIWISAMAMLGPSKAKDLHLLLAVGVMGGFTTFSAFSVDAFLLIQSGMHVQAAFYMVGSVVFSILALMLGMICWKMIAA